MSQAARYQHGFTVIELMVTVAVMLLLLAIAQPSFEGLRQRSAIRGSAEQVHSFWNQARLEAAKRNQFVKVGMAQSDSGKQFCLGAATTTDPTDEEECDCFETDPTEDAFCDVAIFPGDGNQSEWRGVRLTGITLGGSAGINSIEAAVIESKRTNLVDSTDAGSITLSGPTGQFAYKVNLQVDRFGRAVLCESTTATHKLSDYGTRQCSP
ncbi:MAG: prepilin-type N-terminal cleavage/methylation domain-containing protein [Pseudomonas sp.]|nr:prepilin-type N-terminal cleavage/methylation domain-containing protein [Pseudomonas sp.]